LKGLTVAIEFQHCCAAFEDWIHLIIILG
jgi:hypothetical protein